MKTSIITKEIKKWNEQKNALNFQMVIERVKEY